MDLDVAFAAKPVRLTSFKVIDSCPAQLISHHPIHCWIHLNPGVSRHQIADIADDLSRFQVYNWLAAAVERGEIVCIENKYYAPSMLQER